MITIINISGVVGIFALVVAALFGFSIKKHSPGDAKMQEIATTLNIPDNSYRVVVNCGEKAGQTVFHIHFHFLAGRIFSWPPG